MPLPTGIWRPGAFDVCMCDVPIDRLVSKARDGCVRYEQDSKCDKGNHTPPNASSFPSQTSPIQQPNTARPDCSPFSHTTPTNQPTRPFPLTNSTNNCNNQTQRGSVPGRHPDHRPPADAALVRRGGARGAGGAAAGRHHGPCVVCLLS